jgi:hypothetical protein
MKSVQPEENHPGITACVFSRLGGAGDLKERVETDLLLLLTFAATLVLYLAMFTALYLWTLNAPALPPDDAPGPPIAETML